MKLSRRSVLAGAAAVGAGALVTRTLWNPSGAAAEQQVLRIPALLDARKHANSIALQVQAGNTEFFPGRTSRTLGYNGSHLGPTLRPGFVFSNASRSQSESPALRGFF